MIFLDANVFLRQLGATFTDLDVERQGHSNRLFDAVRRGRLVVTTSEVVIHEVCYSLMSPKNYGVSAQDTSADVARILDYAGFRFPTGEREIYLRALDLMAQHERLGFADCVIAARCEAAGHDLATFDRHFDAIETVSRWPWTPATA